MVILNRVALDSTGKIYWNGKQVTPKTLDKYLALGPTLNPEPWIFLETEMGASCASIEAIRDQIEKHVECTNGYRCNEGIKTVWDNVSSPPGTPVS